MTQATSKADRPWLFHECYPGRVCRQNHHYVMGKDGKTLAVSCRNCKREWPVEDRELLVAWASGFRSARIQLEIMAERMSAFVVGVLG